MQDTRKNQILPASWKSLNAGFIWHLITFCERCQMSTWCHLKKMKQKVVQQQAMCPSTYSPAIKVFLVTVYRLGRVEEVIVGTVHVTVITDHWSGLVNYSGFFFFFRLSDYARLLKNSWINSRKKRKKIVVRYKKLYKCRTYAKVYSAEVYSAKIYSAEVYSVEVC